MKKFMGMGKNRVSVTRPRMNFSRKLVRVEIEELASLIYKRLIFKNEIYNNYPT